MIPFRFLPMARPVTRPVLCGATSGSLIASRLAECRGRLAPETLARVLALQPQRLLLAVLLLILVAVASTALSIMKVAPVEIQTTVDGALTSPTLDRIDAVDMSRWEF